MFLQMEPSALRKADDITAARSLSQQGEHLPATLFALATAARAAAGSIEAAEAAEASVYANVANRLRELIDGIRELRVDHDEKRDVLTLQATDESGTVYPAKALSDGTLRFLALAILEYDSSGRNVICLEEPENGIHPTRIPVMLKLLQEIATDLELPVDESNPPRQVIINTHSPLVVRCIPEGSLILARSVQYLEAPGRIGQRLLFKHLPNTWRSPGAAEPREACVTRGEMLSYLGDSISWDLERSQQQDAPRRKRPRLVGEREDLQLTLPLPQ